ncbi:hypothetical protein PSV08DRAFT_36840 [Bipolaris maydis]|uniref:uncharacterized protein n=1 Tax=Cochliobolus heterostrophus TaxID=5016 RepID=UPI0024D0D324|nr:hypothetical protein J3E73DRAFT_18287 [Bipolaris maydis]KAJ6272108.1 hypothetical protein PSV08DRAFT_36840 [Bipolaris maydis]KAJ6281800.1 hypothetical protein J3E71DRAFT_41825 [Bipolaris maydis]
MLGWKGELDAKKKIQYDMLIRNWSVWLHHTRQEGAKALDDIEWQAGWKELKFGRIT